MPPTAKPLLLDVCAKSRGGRFGWSWAVTPCRSFHRQLKCYFSRGSAHKPLPARRKRSHVCAGSAASQLAVKWRLCTPKTPQCRACDVSLCPPTSSCDGGTEHPSDTPARPAVTRGRREAGPGACSLGFINPQPLREDALAEGHTVGASGSIKPRARGIRQHSD